jgi:rubrerythrin
MEVKGEGAVIPPVPLTRRGLAERGRPGFLTTREHAEPRCEMCGHRVVGPLAQRLCPNCGFMAGSSKTFE